MKNARILVADNGASSIKLGVVHGKSKVPTRFAMQPTRREKLTLNQANRIISNAVVRSKGDKSTYVGHEIEDCRDFSSIHYRLPFEKVSTSGLSI